MAVRCSKCQSVNREGSKFCKKCGNELESRCPSCGYPYQEDSLFCDECGYDLRSLKGDGRIDYSRPASYTPRFLADKILRDRGPLEGERKLVTVLFADTANNAEDGIVRFSNIDVFAASNDGLALGAVRAVQSAGKADKIKVYGAGLTLMGAQAVYDGQMRYSTLKTQAKMAERALEFTDLLIQKKPITNKVSLVPPVVIVKDTVTTVKDPMFGGTFTAPETFKPKK